MKNRRLVLVIDQERCIGCEACTVACRIENNTTAPWIWVETQNTLQKNTPEGSFPELRMTFLPQLCNHCANPPCVNACPRGALIKREDGPVVLDETRCDGCLVCIDACPYGAIHFNRSRNVIEKCHFCVHRIDQGLEPFCVVCCEGQAIYFGDLNDPESVVSKIIAQRKTFQLQPEKGTKPSVYYSPPKPKRRL
ncbi:MAG: 4Fe-4S dicluster domain-containing protein [Candidatus Freyarchaeota archaeon]|nr:4Fe-4S dicluster domain-containing protein [Candidatus Jordarchaeia archaeon]MBS7270428.1 4Fe-4S dicluster domain-containing protein [Candidatus Jordarchaeia archaeon]MBS7281210.1 4Fe-4S dicluster domain-containing protein [Candidatus Jordarchaeia archaeon]